MFRRFVLHLAAFLCGVSALPGQTWERVPPERRWTMLDGLPQSSVNAVAQTHDGMLWVATNGGVARFDGRRFRTFLIRTANGDPVDRIQSLVVDARGDLWVGSTVHGVFVMREGVFVEIASGFGAEFLAFDGNGELFAASFRAIRRFGRSAPLPKTVDLPPIGRLSGLVADSRGSIWFSAPEGLFRIDGDAIVRDPRVGRRVVALAAGPDGVVYAAESERLVAVDVADLSKPARVLGGRFTHLAVGRQGELWGSAPSGVYRLVTPDGVAAPLSDVVDFDDLTRRTALFVDRDGAAWVGTAARGLAGCRLGGPRGYRVPSGTPVYGPVAEVDGVVYIATSRGILRQDGEFLRPAGPNEEGGAVLRARTMVAAKDGGLWTGRGQIVERFDVSTGRFGPTYRLPFVIRALHGDGDGVLAAGVGGVARVDLETGAIRRLDGGAFGRAALDEASIEARSGDDLQCVGRDRRGALWVGGDGFVARYEGGTWRRFGRAEGFPGGSVRTIDFGDPDGAVWFGVYGSGLVRIKDERVSTATSAEGLPDDYVAGLLASDDDIVLLSCNKGLYALRRSEMDAAALGSGKIAYEWFGPVAGLVASEGQGAYFPPAVAGAEGYWFSMVEGLAYLRDKPQAGTSPPPIAALDEARCGDVVAAAGEALVGPLGARSLEFSYTAASLGAAGPVYFRYRLEGYDHDWVAAGSRREAFYTGVPPGEYRFVVEAARRDLVFRGAARSGRIVVPAFLHETRGARLGGFLLLLAVGFGVFRVRRRSVQHRELKEREKALTADVAARTRLLTEEIEQRKRAEDDLRRHGEELEERVRVRTAELVQAQRLEGIGRLAGGVAHDLNNLLTVVVGGITSARDDAECRSRIAAALDDAEAAARVAAELSAGLLTFSKRQPARPKVIDPTAAIAAILPMLRRFVGPNYDLRTDCETNVLAIRIDPHQLDQVLLNLVVNAKEAMPRGGSVRLSVSAATLGDGPGVRISVADSGQGMDEATRARVFEPFFTTKGPGLGSGLGLSICYGIVSKAGGVIAIDTAPGRGCVVHLTLPATTDPPEPLVEANAPETRGDARVLLIDDQDAVRRVVRRWLDQLGYAVEEAATVAEARALIEAATRPYDLVLTDVVMPDGGGLAAAGAVRARFPSARVVFMSGFAGDALDADVPEGARLLKKPFRRPELARCLSETLAAPPSGPRT